MNRTERDLEWIAFLIGKKGAAEITDPENLAKIARRNAKAREQKLWALGYNQAMLDHAQFPARYDFTELTREDVEHAVAGLRKDLNYD